MDVCGFISLKAGTPVTVVHQAQAWLGDEGGAMQGKGKTSGVAVQKPQKVSYVFLACKPSETASKLHEIYHPESRWSNFFFHSFFCGAIMTIGCVSQALQFEADISFLFDFAASRGLSKEWNFVAESFLAPEGGGVTGADENVVGKVGKENGGQLVWEGNCNISDVFFNYRKCRACYWALKTNHGS